MEEIKKILILFMNEAKEILGNAFKSLTVYGSYARGDYNENSDIDVMILSSLTENEIIAAEDKLCDKAFDYLMEYGINISVIVKNEKQFNYWLGALPFYYNIKAEGVMIDG